MKHVLAILTSIAAACLSGCMVATPQPGQTPQQVQACTVDATMHNIVGYTAGVLTTGAATQATIATQEDANVAKTFAVTGAVTAGVAAAMLAGQALLGESYTADKCSPAPLPGNAP